MNEQASDESHFIRFECVFVCVCVSLYLSIRRYTSPLRMDKSSVNSQNRDLHLNSALFCMKRNVFRLSQCSDKYYLALQLSVFGLALFTLPNSFTHLRSVLPFSLVKSTNLATRCAHQKHGRCQHKKKIEDDEEEEKNDSEWHNKITWIKYNEMESII